MIMQRLLVALVLLAVLAAGSVLLLGEDAAGDGLAGDAALASESTTARDAAPKQQLPGPQSAGTTTVEDEADTERRVTQGTEVPSDVVPVSVVDKLSKKPLAGAEVLYQVKNTYNYDELTADEVTEVMALASDSEKLLRRFGRSTHTNDDGIALIRRTKHRWQMVLAVYHDSEKRAFFGQTYLNAGSPDDSKPAEIQVERDYTLRVRVVDRAGRPQGDVPIALAGKSFRGTNKTANPFFFAAGKSSAPSGLFELRHFQNWTRNYVSGRQRLVSMHAVPNLAGLPPVGPEIPVPEPPAEPLELKLPMTGSMTVHVVDPTGTTVLDATVQLGVVEPDQRRNGPRSRPALGNLDGWRAPGTRRTTTAKTDAHGVARFPRVALSKTWKVSVRAGPGRAEQTLAGPSSPGQDMRVRLALLGDTVIVTGTALDADGRPFAGKHVTLRIVQSGNPRGSGRAKTDDSGRFMIAMKKNLVTRPVDAWIFTGLDHPYKRSGPMAKLVEPKSVRLGTQDLGDIRLSDPPLVLDVRLEDHTGAPAEANLVLQRPVARIDKNGVRSMTWQYDNSGMRPKLVSPGHYQYHGYPTSKRLRVAVYSTTYLPTAPVEFDVGATGLVIKLVTGSTMTATVMTDVPLPSRSLRLELRPMSARGTVKTGRERSGKTTTSKYSWAKLGAGTYSLDVRLWGQKQPLLTLDNLVCTLATPCKDPRLDAIDLRGRLRVFDVSVFTRSSAKAAPKPVTTSRAAVLLVGPDGAPEAEAFRVRKGKARLVTTRSVDLLVAVRGYNPERLRAVISDTSVTLDKEKPIRITLEPEAPVQLPNATSLWVYVRSPRSDSKRYKFQTGGGGTLRTLLQGRAGTAQLVSGSATALSLSSLGTYSLTYWLRRGNKNQPLRGVTTDITVRENGQTIEFALPATAIQEALARFR